MDPPDVEKATLFDAISGISDWLPVLAEIDVAVGAARPAGVVAEGNRRRPPGELNWYEMRLA